MAVTLGLRSVSVARPQAPCGARPLLGNPGISHPSLTLGALWAQGQFSAFEVVRTTALAWLQHLIGEQRRYANEGFAWDCKGNM